MMKRAMIGAAVLALAACSPKSEEPAPAAPPSAPQPVATPEPESTPPPLQGGTDNWREVAKPSDVERFAGLSGTWTRTIMDARAAGLGADIDNAGLALKPDAGLPGRIQPTPGDYTCRTYKFGNPVSSAGLRKVADVHCRVELTPGGDLVLTQTTGALRPHGLVYPDTDKRGVFIGAQAQGDEAFFPNYGDKPERDQIGIVERIGDQRWRVVFPHPNQDSLLDVMVLQR